MNKAQIVNAIQSEQVNKRMYKNTIAQTIGLNAKTVEAAMSLQGNPRLSTFMSILDVLGLEIELVPKGYGAPSTNAAASTAIPSIVDAALSGGNK